MEVLGGIMCLQRHGWLMRLGLAAALDERPGWPLQKFFPGVQRCQVMHNDILARNITVRDVGGGHGAEVHGGGKLVPSETLTEDTMPGVCS